MDYTIALQVWHQQHLMYINHKYLQMFLTLLGPPKFKEHHAIQLLKAANIVYFIIHCIIQEQKENIYLQKTKNL
jgi:hypothetical protein